MAAGLQVLGISLPYKALVLARRGELDSAMAVIESVLPSTRASGDLQLVVPAFSAAALVAFECQDVAGAIARVRERIDAARSGSDRYRSLFLGELTRMCVCAGEQALAAELGEGLSVDTGRIGAERTSAAAVLAEADGRPAEALPLFEDAARRWRDVTGLTGVAASLLGAARCLLALDRPAAEAPLAEASELFAAMGDRAGLAEIDELGRRLVQR
jgi:hypothetical protein